MGEYCGGLSKSGTRQHGRPEQSVEVDDVFANEMVKLGISFWLPIAFKIITCALTQILVTRDVANRCV